VGVGTPEPMSPNERTTRSEMLALPSEMEALVVAGGRKEAYPIVSFVRSQKLNVQLITNAETAFEEALIHPPDVMLVDNSVGPAGGIELCERLKGNSRTHFVPVILWGVSKDRAYRLRALEAGADAVFSSDTEVQETRTRLWALLRTHAMYRRQERKHLSYDSAIQVRRRWVDGFAHDLQNSMSTLQANIDYLAARLAGAGVGDRDSTECLEDTRSVVSDVVRGLRTVLDYEHWEAGRLVPHQNQTAVDEFLTRVATELSAASTLVGKKLTVHSNTGSVLRLDTSLVGGAIYNLANHVLRHPLIQSLHLQAIRCPNALELCIDGSGQPADEMDFEGIFEPFARTSQNASSGHGLGLGLAKAVIEMHDGEVETWSGRSPATGQTGWGFKVILEDSRLK